MRATGTSRSRVAQPRLAHALTHVLRVLARAIDYLAGRAGGAEPEDQLGEAVDREFARAVRNVSGRGMATQLTPEMLDELRCTIGQIIAAHEERHREEDKQRAFWRGTLSDTQEALAELWACEESAAHNDRH